MSFKTLDDLPDDLHRQARACPRRSQRADAGRGRQRRHAVARRGADHRRTERPRRNRASLIAFRPAEGASRARTCRRRSLVKPLSQLLGRSVRFIEDCQGPDAERAVTTMTPGSVGILENTRFHDGEEKNDPELAKAMAALGDYYVDDAFSTAHRAHASTEGHHAFPPELRRPRDGSRAESAGARARQSRAARCGGGRRARKSRPSSPCSGISSARSII